MCPLMNAKSTGTDSESIADLRSRTPDSRTSPWVQLELQYGDVGLSVMPINDSPRCHRN